MDETSHELVMMRRFLRRHFVRIVIDLLAVAAYSVVSVYATYQRERRIAREIEAFGGTVVFQYAGPDWIPLSVRDRVPFFNRVTFLDLQYKQFTDAALEHLKGLSNLKSISLANTQVTDAGLEDLKGLTNCMALYLNNTEVTDAGLEHLKGLTGLRYLYFNDTEVTAEGRAMLRNALPDCLIEPDP